MDLCVIMRTYIQGPKQKKNALSSSRAHGCASREAMASILCGAAGARPWLSLASRAPGSARRGVGPTGLPRAGGGRRGAGPAAWRRGAGAGPAQQCGASTARGRQNSHGHGVVWNRRGASAAGARVAGVEISSRQRALNSCSSAGRLPI